MINPSAETRGAEQKRAAVRPGAPSRCCCSYSWANTVNTKRIAVMERICLSVMTIDDNDGQKHIA
jgi:hypothetical protein